MTDQAAGQAADQALSIRVVDRGASSPFYATVLGEFGADVIKVEKPGDGRPHSDRRGAAAGAQGAPPAPPKVKAYPRYPTGRAATPAGTATAGAANHEQEHRDAAGLPEEISIFTSSARWELICWVLGIEQEGFAQQSAKEW